MSRHVHPLPKDTRKKIKRRMQLKRQSQKMALKQIERTKLRRQWLGNAANQSRSGMPLCEAGLHVCSGIATDVHEVLTRARGGDILDRGNCRLICRSCHQWIHTHPLEAVALGLLEHQWQRLEED